MEFINLTGKDVKIRLGTRKKPEWKLVKKSETVDLANKVGLRNGFTASTRLPEEVQEAMKINAEKVEKVDKEKADAKKAETLKKIEANPEERPQKK